MFYCKSSFIGGNKENQSINLEIEKGRYKNISVNERKCKLCNNNGAEDEIHFLLQCPSLHSNRSYFIQNVTNQYQNFSRLDD